MSKTIAWGMTIAALVMLGGCANQPTAPGGDAPDTFRSLPIPSLNRPSLRPPLPSMSPSCLALEGQRALADDAQIGPSEECQQQFTSWREARLTAWSGESIQFSAIPDGLCSVTGHDVVVSTIEELRTAVAGSAPGTVIGIDGVLDINGDGGSDVTVTSDGITLTCASDGAGLVGRATVAVLYVPASQVRIEWLDITALPETGGGDRSRGVRVEGDGATVSHNRVGCARTCIAFNGSSQGTVEYNDITTGFKYWGFAAVDGHDVVVRNNLVGDCLFCIEFDDHANGVVEDNHVTMAGYGVYNWGASALSITGNTMAGCFGACVIAEPSFSALPSHLSMQGNHLSGCGDLEPVWTDGCIWLIGLNGGRVEGNEIHGDVTAAAVRIVTASTDVVVHDNIAEGSLWAFRSERISFTKNTVSDCGGGTCVLMYVTDGQVHGNHVTGNTMANTGISGEWSPGGLSVVGNTVRGSFQGLEAWGIFLLGLDHSVVSGNDIAVEVDGPFGAGGLSLDRVNDSRVENNRIHLGQGAPTSMGIQLVGQAFVTKTVDHGQVVNEDRSYFLPVTGTALVANRVSGAGVGLFVNGACSNTFVGNNLARNDVNAVFSLAGVYDVTPDPGNPNVESITEGYGTGANTLTGNGNAVVEGTRQGLPIAENGYLDCDGDGVRDPNSYSGTRVVRGGGVGAVVGQILSQLHTPAP